MLPLPLQLALGFEQLVLQILQLHQALILLRVLTALLRLLLVYQALALCLQFRDAQLQRSDGCIQSHPVLSALIYLIAKLTHLLLQTSLLLQLLIQLLTTISKLTINAQFELLQLALSPQPFQVLFQALKSRSRLLKLLL